MDITLLSPDDAGTLDEVAELLDAARLADCPDEIPHTGQGYGDVLRHGWDLEPPAAYVARDGNGSLVGLLGIDLPERDNTHLAWFELTVHPAYRRRGLGSDLLAFGTERARAAGRRSVGIAGWDIRAAAGFAERHGFARKAINVNRRQLVGDIDHDILDKLYDEAERASTGYDLVRIEGTVPDDLLDDVVAMTAAINDAPTDDLDIEDEVFSRERIRAFETAMAGRGRTLYRTVARHVASGTLGGHSLVAVEHERPEIGWQLDTAVTRAHRGHRLGILLKIDVLRRLRDAEPQLRSIDTWNAESNDHMVAVNEQLGYQVVARGIQYQRDL